MVRRQLRAKLLRIGTRTNAITDSFAVGAGSSGVAVGEDAVWVANSVDGTVSRIGPDSATIVLGAPVMASSLRTDRSGRARATPCASYGPALDVRSFNGRAQAPAFAWDAGRRRRAARGRRGGARRECLGEDRRCHPLVASRGRRLPRPGACLHRHVVGDRERDVRQALHLSRPAGDGRRTGDPGGRRSVHGLQRRHDLHVRAEADVPLPHGRSRDRAELRQCVQSTGESPDGLGRSGISP